jgi:hypothetical protein
MKTTLLVLAAAALSGCAVYPSPAYETYDSTVIVPYGVVQPTYIYGGAYPHGYGHRAYPRGYHQPSYRAAPHAVPRPHLHAPHPGHGAREHLHNRLREGPRLPHHRR